MLLNDHGFSEVQVALGVLCLMVVCVALLSYFVLAPEYEKHLEKQYAAVVEETNRNYASKQQETHLQLHHKRMLRKQMSLSSVKARHSAMAHDVEIASHGDDELSEEAHKVTITPSISASSSPATSPRSAMTKRRKSESDASKDANINKAEMLRRRVLLRKLEEEIGGAIEEIYSKPNGFIRSRRMSCNEIAMSEDKLQMLLTHPPDCSKELEILARLEDTESIRRALRILHDVLSFHLSVDHRDLNKVTVFCNSLLKHDGLNSLRNFEFSMDQEIRSLSNSIIEKAVPAIWH
ncbi:TPA: hypothetical protein N0F65_011590 [Lagenidium giganteum]|uniref:Uncharacterized protein n=1 Tax=Lagenidium giganteum TaxID=4803 RepID=A0AAV2ZA98_9STRA|nr:TPA: hypothetical protein N0F65_011590 [Lagenidium giganteum]